MYLNRNNILSYNAAINFIVLKRGYGKSYGFKTYVIERYLKNKGRFIWLKRNRSELRDCVDKFLVDIIDVFPNIKLSVSGHKLFVNGEVAGYFVCLSTVIGKKSAPYNDVDSLIYDEFIPELGYSRYIPNEPVVFASFLTSVFRDRKIHAYLLGNMIEKITPYNMYFNLPPFESNIYIKERGVLIYCNDNNDKIESNYIDSDIERFLKGTTYYDYALKNKSLTDSDDFIAKRENNMEQIFIVNINGIDVGFFADYSKSRIIADTKCDTSTRRKFCFKTDNLKESYFLFTRTMYYGKLLKEMFLNGRLFYSNQKTKIICKDLINCL